MKSGTSFINKSACREFLLDKAQAKWQGKFTRVSKDVFEMLESLIRNDMESFIRAHPTLGKTLTAGTKAPAASEILANIASDLA